MLNRRKENVHSVTKTIKKAKVWGAGIVCLDCGTSSTPWWRMGPTGA
jgi:hypothetical protein